MDQTLLILVLCHHVTERGHISIQSAPLAAVSMVILESSPEPASPFISVAMATAEQRRIERIFFVLFLRRPLRVRKSGATAATCGSLERRGGTWTESKQKVPRRDRKIIIIRDYTDLKFIFASI